MTLPAITINYRNEVATNTATGATCDIIRKDSTWYTNAAGIIALERDIYDTEQIRNILYTRTHRKSKPFFNLVKPLNFNGEWLYSVKGWEQFRQTIIVRTPNK